MCNKFPPSTTAMRRGGLKYTTYHSIAYVTIHKNMICNIGYVKTTNTILYELWYNVICTLLYSTVDYSSHCTAIEICQQCSCLQSLLRPGHHQIYGMSEALGRTIQIPSMFTWGRDLVPITYTRE